MWTDDPLFLPETPISRKILARRHNHEHVAVMAREMATSRKYLCERLNWHDRKEVADDIANGQVYDALAVFVFNPIEGTSSDISEEVARDILNRHGITRSSVDFLEDQLGVQRIRKP
jgi:hypothetical protein